VRPPARHWRSYGTEPLPTPAEAIGQPMRAFPSWFLRITCDRCGKDSMLDEAHMGAHRRGRSAGCAMTVAGAGQGGPSCSPAATASPTGRCARSC
jgi:hypothetical protein